MPPPPRKPAKKRKPKASNRRQTLLWGLGLVFLLVYVANHMIEHRLAKVRQFAIAGGASEEQATRMTAPLTVLRGALEGQAGRNARFAARKQEVDDADRAYMQETLSKGTNSYAKPLLDPQNQAVVDALAQGDLATAKRLTASPGATGEARLRLGQCLDATGQDATALKELQTAVTELASAQPPLRAEALVALGTALLRQGDHLHARIAAEQALTLWRNDEGAHRLAAEVARRDERWSDVIGLLDRYVRAFTVPEFNMRLYEAYLASGDPLRAQDAMGQGASDARAEDVSAPPMDRIRMDLELPYGRGLDAAAAAVAGSHWHDVEFQVLAAEVASRRKDWPGVKTAADAAAGTGVHDARVWYWQGRAAEGLGDHRAATALFNQAMAHDPHFDPKALAWLVSGPNGR